MTHSKTKGDEPAFLLLNKSENTAAATFRSKHRCKKNATRVLILEVSPTGIADNIIATCKVCGKSEDVSDYSSW